MDAPLGVEQADRRQPVEGERLQPAPAVGDRRVGHMGEYLGQQRLQAPLMGQRRPEPGAADAGVAAAVGRVLREQAVRLVAASAAAEQQPEASVGLADLAPPRDARGEAAAAGTLRQRRGHQHLPALGAQRAGEGWQELRYQGVGGHAQVGGAHASVRGAYQMGSAAIGGFERHDRRLFEDPHPRGARDGGAQPHHEPAGVELRVAVETDPTGEQRAAGDGARRVRVEVLGGEAVLRHQGRIAPQRRERRFQVGAVAAHQHALARHLVVAGDAVAGHLLLQQLLVVVAEVDQGARHVPGDPRRQFTVGDRQPGDDAALVARRRAFAYLLRLQHDTVETVRRGGVGHFQPGDAGADDRHVGAHVAGQSRVAGPIDVQPVGQAVAGQVDVGRHQITSRKRTARISQSSPTKSVWNTHSSSPSGSRTTLG